jgi:hypothetical protein
MRNGFASLRRHFTPLGRAQSGPASARRRVIHLSPARLVAIMYAFAALLVTLAMSAFFVGLHDAALTNVGLGVRIGSGALIVVSAVLVIAAAELVLLSRRSRWEWGVVRPRCKPIVLIALLIAFLIGLYLLFAGLQTAGTHRAIVVSASLALIGVAFVGLIFFGSEAKVTLPRLGAIALALIGTGIGLWQFWYQNQYVPSRAGRAVSLKVDLLLEGKQEGHDVVRATLDYEDIGGRSVSVIGSTYTLTGSRLVRCQRPASATNVQPFFSGFLLDPQRSRFMADVWEIQPAKVLAAGKFVSDGKRLEPDVPAGRSLVFLVPHGRYQLLRFRAQLFAIPASVPLSQRRRPEYVRFKGDNYVYGFWHIDDDSWLHDLVYGREQWVVIRYEVVSQPGSEATSPDLRVTARFPNPTWTHEKPSEAQVHDLFGVVEVQPGRFANDPVSFAERQPSDASEPFAGTELALADVAEPTGRDSLPRECRPQAARP